MPPSRVWTVDELGELPADARYELVNGSLKWLTYTPIHQQLVVGVWEAVGEHCPEGWLSSFQLSLAVDLRNEPRPDVVVIRMEHANSSAVPVEDVILVVEVISPESTFGELITKAKVYAEAGVATYWVIDPLGDTISLTEMVLEEAPRQYAIARHTTDVFTTERPHPVILDLPALTARRAALVERVKP